MNEWSLLDWSDLTLGGDEDDDPNVPDEDDTPEAIHAADEPEVEESAEEAEAAPADGAQADPAKPAEEQKPVEEQGPAERTFTQAELQAEIDRVLAQRLAREKAATERKVQQATGKTLEALLEEHRQAQIQYLQETHLMAPDQAAAYVAQQEELARLKTEKEQLEETARVASYERSKAKLSTNPHFKAMEEEVDAFTGQGASGLDAEQGFYYLLGQKMAAGQLMPQIQKTAEQKAIRQMQKAKQAAPVAAGAGTGTGGHGLTAAELAMAKRLGVSPEAYARNKTRKNDDE